jgi:hypothetical protein
MQDCTLDIIACPECEAPAEVVDRFALDSTDGPTEHLTVLCIRRHRFTALAEGAGGSIAEHPAASGQRRQARTCTGCGPRRAVGTPTPVGGSARGECRQPDEYCRRGRSRRERPQLRPRPPRRRLGQPGHQEGADGGGRARARQRPTTRSPCPASSIRHPGPTQQGSSSTTPGRSFVDSIYRHAATWQDDLPRSEVRHARPPLARDPRRAGGTGR